MSYRGRGVGGCELEGGGGNVSYRGRGRGGV